MLTAKILASVLIVLALIVVCSAILIRAQYFTVRRVLRVRCEYLPEEWFARYLPQADQHLAVIQELLALMGAEIGVSWTRFRLEDSFDNTLRLRKLGLSALREAWDDQETAWFARQGIWPQSALPNTLGGYLNAILTLLNEKPTAN